MKIIIKKLQGEECVLEVLPTMIVTDIKKQIWKKLGVPIKEQKLLLLGRMLPDNQSIGSHPAIKDGTKIYLVIKKPVSLYEHIVTHCKKSGINSSEAAIIANKHLSIINKNFSRMSWDDIDRLCANFLIEEQSELCLPKNEATDDNEMNTM